MKVYYNRLNDTIREAKSIKIKFPGYVQDGEWHGKGTYVGEFKDGMRHGQGTMTYASGLKYAGEWQDGKWHGQGTLTHTDGTKYVGEWKDNLPDG